MYFIMPSVVSQKAYIFWNINDFFGLLGDHSKKWPIVRCHIFQIYNLVVINIYCTGCFTWHKILCLPWDIFCSSEHPFKCYIQGVTASRVYKHPWHCHVDINGRKSWSSFWHTILHFNYSHSRFYKSRLQSCTFLGYQKVTLTFHMLRH